MISLLHILSVVLLSIYYFCMQSLLLFDIFILYFIVCSNIHRTFIVKLFLWRDYPLISIVISIFSPCRLVCRMISAHCKTNCQSRLYRLGKGPIFYVKTHLPFLAQIIVSRNMSFFATDQLERSYIKTF